MVHFAEINHTPPSLFNVGVHWQSSNSEACAKKLSQILENNVDNVGRGIGLIIYMKYCSYQIIV